MSRPFVGKISPAHENSESSASEEVSLVDDVRCADKALLICYTILILPFKLRYSTQLTIQSIKV